MAQRRYWVGNLFRNIYQALWSGVYNPLEPFHYMSQQVLNDGFLVMANKDNTDSPSPQNDGDPIYLLPDSPTWVELDNPKAVYTGIVVTPTTSDIYQVQGVRFYVPNIDSSYSYSLWITVLKDGDEAYRLLAEYNGSDLVLGWNTYNITGALFTGNTLTNFSVVLKTLNSASNTVVIAEYNRQSDSNSAPPETGLWNKNINNRLLRINVVDSSAANIETELLSMVAGTSIVFADSSDSNRSVTYSVLSTPSLVSNHVEYEVLEIDTGIWGVPLVGSLTTMTATTPNPSVTEYVELANGFNTSPQIQGSKSLTGVYSDYVLSENANGIDLLFQKKIQSEFWEVQSYSPELSKELNTIGITVAKSVSCCKQGISIAQVSGGIASQSFTTSYAQVQLTNVMVYESPENVIETTHPSGKDSVKFYTTSIHKFNAVFYITGSTNKELFVKAYKNGVEVSPGDPVGIQLLGISKPVALPFSGHIPITAGDVITYYARGDGNGSFEISGGNATWEKTSYKI